MDETEAAYRAVMAGDDPDDAAHAAVDLGSLLADRGRLEEAVAALQVAIDSENAQASLTATRRLGLVLKAIGRLGEAEWAFRRAMAAGRTFESGAAAVSLAVMLHDAGRLDDAEAAYREAMRSADPGVVDLATGNLANLLRATGRQDEAEATYRIAANSDDPTTRAIAQSNLADFLLEHKRWDEAERLLREVIAGGHPKYGPKAASRLGWLLTHSGRREEAIAFLRQTINGDDPTVKMQAAANLGITLRDLNRPREAEEAFRVAASLGDSAATIELAKLLEHRGATDEALELYRTLAERGSHPLYIEVATEAVNRLLDTPGAESPGVARVMANLDAIVGVLRRHGALFAYLPHRPWTQSITLRTDRTVVAWFDPDRPIPDPSVVESQIGPVVDKVEVLNDAPLEARYHIAITGRLILDDDRPARVGWLADMRMVLFDKWMFTIAAGGARTHAVNFLSAPNAPPARMAEMLQFVRTYREGLLDSQQARETLNLLSAVSDVDVLTEVRDRFFAAVVGCTRIAHMVIVDNEWEPPASAREVFDTLVEHGVIGASVAGVLSSAEDALDAMFPVATKDQVMQTCFDPTYTDCIEQFLAGIEKRAVGVRRRFRPWRRR